MGRLTRWTPKWWLAERARALVLHQNGKDLRAPRIEGEPVTPKVIQLDPKLFDRYVGRYQLTAQSVLALAPSPGM
jgi:hypothetical protein